MADAVDRVVQMMYTNYRSLCLDVIDNGAAVESRFGDTLELTGDVSFRFQAGDIPDRPKMSLQVCFCELMQLLAGIYDPSMFKKLSPNAQHSLFTKEMAYGPRTYEFIPRIIQELRANPNTREAILFVGRAYQTCTSSEPCTNSLQFLVRGKELKTVVSMRSLDLLKGLPVDMVMFGGLAQAIAACVGEEIKATDITIQVGSAHIYCDDITAGKVPTQTQRKRRFTVLNFATDDPHTTFDAQHPPEWQDYVNLAMWNVEHLWTPPATPFGITLETEENV